MQIFREFFGSRKFLLAKVSSPKVYLSEEIPEESCLFDKCENLELLCQGI